MTTYICKCGRRVKKSTDASTTGNRLSGYAPGHECWGCPYAMPYGNYQWDKSARTVSRETQGYECRMSKTLTYASEFAGSIKDKSKASTTSAPSPASWPSRKRTLPTSLSPTPMLPNSLSAPLTLSASSRIFWPGTGRISVCGSRRRSWPGRNNSVWTN